MTEHLTYKQIEGYGRRTLSATELLSATDHLGGCETCRRQVAQSLNGDLAFLAVKSGVFDEGAATLASPIGREHLSFEQTAQYVDGALAGEQLQVVKDHLAGCEQCVVTVNDLFAFKAQVASDLNHEYQPSETGGGVEKQEHWLIAAFSSLVPRSPLFAFSSALTALLLIASGWLIWQTLQRKETPPDLTRTATTTPSPIAPSVTPVVSPTLSIESAGELLAQLNDGGGQLMLDRDGNLSGPPGFDDLPPAYRQMVQGALSNQRLEKPQSLAGLTRLGSIAIRGGEKDVVKFSVIEPVGKVILSDRPTLSWSRLDGATGYVVEIYDEKVAQIAISPQLTENSWTPPQSLQRGVIYSWQVKAVKDGQEFIAPRAPAPQAKFRILDQAKANEIRQARRAYSSSHLTLALLYTQAGLLDEAEQELRALQKANPNSPIVRRLLSNLRALRNK